MAEVRLRRVYEPPEAGDGARVLVDRLWPRGLRRDAANLEEWLREVAPSDHLRRWYGHGEERFQEFRRRYLEELSSGPPAAALAHLRELSRKAPITLLTATKELQLSQAVVLAQLLDSGVAEGAEEGGDPACWQHRVCPACGAVADSDPPVGCPACGEPIPAMG